MGLDLEARVPDLTALSSEIFSTKLYHSQAGQLILHYQGEVRILRLKNKK